MNITKSFNSCLISCKKKINKMNTEKWITLTLWLTTFILLIVFVILAATLKKEIPGTEKISAENKIIWGTAQPKDFQKLGDMNANVVYDELSPAARVLNSKGEFQWIARIPEYTKNVVIPTKEYANSLASVGFVFAITLFGALLTTVLFANRKRKAAK